MGEPAGEAPHERLGAAEERIHVGFELQNVLQEAMDFERLRRGFPLRDRAADSDRKFSPPARIDNLSCRDARTLRRLDQVVGAIEKILNRGWLPETLGELGHERLAVARELQGDKLGLTRIVLCQAFRSLLEKTTLLLNQQQVAC